MIKAIFKELNKEWNDFIGLCGKHHNLVMEFIWAAVLAFPLGIGIAELIKYYLW